MTKQVKKIVSVVLVACLTMMLMVPVFAEKTHHIVINAEKHLTVIPVEGSAEYVTEGDSYKFYVQADQGYSKVRLIVSIYDTDEVLEPDVHGVYTIENVTEDLIVNVFFTQDKQSSNFMSSLIILLRNIVNWFKSIFEKLFNI